MPRHKGKVESGIKFAQTNALKGRQFASLAAENAFLTEWERTVADTRIHGTIRQQVGTFFTQAEQPKLRALPAALFPCFVEAKRTVHRDGHLAYDQAYYSAPPEYVGREVWVRAETRWVRLYNLRFEAIAVHVRAERGRFATADAHIHSHKRVIIERGADYLRERCGLLGAHCGAWAEGLLAQRGPTRAQRDRLCHPGLRDLQVRQQPLRFDLRRRLQISRRFRHDALQRIGPGSVLPRPPLLFEVLGTGVRFQVARRRAAMHVRLHGRVTDHAAGILVFFHEYPVLSWGDHGVCVKSPSATAHAGRRPRKTRYLRVGF